MAKEFNHDATEIWVSRITGVIMYEKPGDPERWTHWVKVEAGQDSEASNG